MEEVFKKAEISEGVNVDGENLSNLRFADDVALLNETSKQMEKHMNNLNSVSMKVGLKIHKEKDKVTDNLCFDNADNRLVSLLTLLIKVPLSQTSDQTTNLKDSTKVVILFWNQWHCVQVIHILSYQQNTVCFCGRLKLFVFALEIWCSPRFCPWSHSFYPILSTCF